MHLQKRSKRQKIPGSARSAAGRPILYGNYNIFRKVLSILFREKSGRCRGEKKSPRSCRGEKASVEAVGLDFSDHIQNRAVPGFHHGDNLVLPLQGVRGADQVVSLFLEALNADCGNTSVIQTFPDILAEYHRRFPRVRLQITTDQSRNLYRQMVEGSLDAAIIRGDYNWDGARFLLSRERVCVICERGLEEIPLKSQLYIGRKTDSALETATLRWMNEQGLDGIRTGLSVDSITTCVEMVRRGLGWSVVPEIALKSFEGCIRPCVFENGEPFVRDTTLICRGESLRLPQVKAFVEQLKQPEAGI